MSLFKLLLRRIIHRLGFLKVRKGYRLDVDRKSFDFWRRDSSIGLKPNEMITNSE